MSCSIAAFDFNDEWKALLDFSARLGYDTTTEKGELVFYVVCTFLTVVGMFWGMNAIYGLCYHFNLFPQWKIQRGKMPDRELIWKCVKSVATSHVLSGPALVLPYYAARYFGASSQQPLPTWSRIFFEYFCFAVINDTAFYFVHRTFHTKWLYANFHKQHHQFNVSIGIAAQYAHPVEEVFANTLPTLLGPVLLGAHHFTFFTWMILRMLETLDAHSGYDFPFSPFRLCQVADRHDFHHSHNIGCFGGFFAIWDRLLGTDKDYLLWKSKQQFTAVPNNKSE